MESALESPGVASQAAAAEPPSRVVEIRPEESKILCVLGDGRHCALSQLVGSHARAGDELSVGWLAESSSEAEVYIRKPSIRRGDVYHLKAGYAALPKPDKRDEYFVRLEIVAGRLGIQAVHIPCAAIRDYFFAVNRKAAWSNQPSFYSVLRLRPEVSCKEMRLAYHIRRMELLQANAPKSEFATVERAYNVLADPDLRALYDELRKDFSIPVPFPYSGFGSLLVQGERSSDTAVFFANRILAFLPERRRRTVPVPLRKLDYFDDYAILRDRRRKLEVLVDHELLPLLWDPTWSQWRHLITATVKISSDFIHTGRYRKRRGEWKLIEWDTALPSRTEIELPKNVHDDILNARRTHTRFGRYWKEIDELRRHVEQIPTERKELERLCWKLGLPGDFDVAQITWRPDYDPYYQEQLSKRARAMFLFRDEYIFDLEKAVVVEVPQAGHATYVFAKPADIELWVGQYARTTRQEIRLNRDNVAESLGFLGRVVHGKSKTEWSKDLRPKIGEPPAYPDEK